MTSRRFFFLLRRINSLLIFAAGVVAVLVLLLAAAVLFTDANRARRVGNVINLESQEAAKDKAVLGDFVMVDGSAVLRAPLHLSQQFAYGASSKGTDSIQNYFYLDSASHTSHWLIPDYRGLILETTELPARDYGRTEGGAVEVVVYQLVDGDSNGNGSLTEQDMKTIAISDRAGKGFVRLVSKVDNLHGTHLVGKGRMILVYAAGGVLHSADVDLATGKIVRDSALKAAPVMPKNRI